MYVCFGHMESYKLAEHPSPYTDYITHRLSQCLCNGLQNLASSQVPLAEHVWDRCVIQPQAWCTVSALMATKKMVLFLCLSCAAFSLLLIFPSACVSFFILCLNLFSCTRSFLLCHAHQGSPVNPPAHQCGVPVQQRQLFNHQKDDPVQFSVLTRPFSINGS